MYACMYVEAPEGSKTVSLSLSLSLSLRRLCTGLEGKGALGTPPRYHSPQRIKTAFSMY